MPKRKPESVKSSRRQKASKEPLPEVRIYCNGRETEKNYFDSLICELRLPFKVRVIAKDHNRLSLVKEVSRCLKHDGFHIDNEHHVWVVFDVDACSKGNDDTGNIKCQADNAVHSCDTHKIKYIVSNDSFEYWFYLHYKRDFTHRHRDNLVKLLSEMIGEKYEKHTPMYERIRHLQNDALRRAQELKSRYNSTTSVSQREPFTNVDELISFLKGLGTAPPKRVIFLRVDICPQKMAVIR